MIYLKVIVENGKFCYIQKDKRKAENKKRGKAINHMTGKWERKIKKWKTSGQKYLSGENYLIRRQ